MINPKFRRHPSIVYSTLSELEYVQDVIISRINSVHKHSYTKYRIFKRTHDNIKATYNFSGNGFQSFWRCNTIISKLSYLKVNFVGLTNKIKKNGLWTLNQE